MQTFLPYPEFDESAATLDNVRLACQVKECYQIMQALLLDKGWIHHPVTKMWAGHEWELLLYQDACEAERARRGRSVHESYVNLHRLYFRYCEPEEIRWPRWLGDPRFHISHQSNLVRKDPDFYGPQFPGVPNDIPYLYPE